MREREKVSSNLRHHSGVVSLAVGCASLHPIFKAFPSRSGGRSSDCRAWAGPAMDGMRQTGGYIPQISPSRTQKTMVLYSDQTRKIHDCLPPNEPRIRRRTGSHCHPRLPLLCFSRHAEKSQRHFNSQQPEQSARDSGFTDGNADVNCGYGLQPNRGRTQSIVVECTAPHLLCGLEADT